MPYRVRGTRVEVKKAGQWKTAKGGQHATRQAAKKHQRALQANVKK